MSQGILEKDNPWSWSDQTIVGLMNELEKVKALVETHPNDMELGEKVRQWYHKSRRKDG